MGAFLVRAQTLAVICGEDNQCAIQHLLRRKIRKDSVQLIINVGDFSGIEIVRIFFLVFIGRLIGVMRII